MGKIVEDNIAYSLIEVQGLIDKEIRLRSKSGLAYLQMSPYGAAALGRELLHWATLQDSDLAKIYYQFIELQP